MTEARPTLRFIVSHPAHLISLGFGTGLAPAAPGTVGSLLGFPLFALLHGLPVLECTLAYAALFVGGMRCATVTERALGGSDPGCVVVDEILAMALVLEFTPNSWPWFVAAFALFRIFDIVKPWPIYLADRADWAGFGIMLDDILAAVAAVASIKAMVWLAALMGLPGLV